MAFEITKEITLEIKALIEAENAKELTYIYNNFHFADLAEILDTLSIKEATYLVKILDTETTSDALMELEDDVREAILKQLSAKEIAEELEELDTDDAADIINELPQDRVENVMAEIEDEDHAGNIVDLLRYEEDTAGGLMAKELIQVNENWTVTQCLNEIKKQAENVSRVHSIYVIDDHEKLKGRLSLRDLMMASAKKNIRQIYIPKVDFVTVNTNAEEVSRIMQKYDLEAIPVVDETGRLKGRITIDDIVDFIKDEAEKDYQMAAGISSDVEADDGILELTKARLPWLVLGLLGGLGSVYIMEGFEGALEKYSRLFYFTPLIAAMAGNVGVQSSAIIVQGLANDNVKGSLLNRLIKEVGLSLINGFALAVLVLIFGAITGLDIAFSFTIAISMLSVIIFAALIGTFVPIILHKRGIDPAIATGPFITTSNDIFGIFLFFYISKLILGF